MQSHEFRTLIMKSLVFLASVCDGANSKDNQGFNGSDTVFGKQLASYSRQGKTLTVPQLRVAYKMLLKYEKQLKNQEITLPKTKESEEIFTRLEKNISTNPHLCSSPSSLTASYRNIKKHNRTHFKLDFSFNAELIKQFRELYNVQCKKEKKEYFWYLAIADLELIQKFANDYKFDIDPEVIQQLKTRENTLKRRLKFCLDYLQTTKINFTPYEHQWDAVKTFLKYPLLRGLISDEMGLGKALVNSELVLTPDGYTEMKNIEQGMWVIGKNGLATQVLKVYPQGLVDCYRVTFNDDTHLDTCGDHQWLTETRIHAKKHITQVITTKEMLKTGLRDETNYKYRIPLVDPVEFTWKNNKINPYVLGYLLGNGSFTGKGGVKISTKDSEIIDLFKLQLKENQTLKQSKSNPYDWDIKGNGSNNWIREELNNLKLGGRRAENKFIPNNYKFTDFEDRLAIFQGLMDSDGSYSRSSEGKNSGNLEFSSSSLQLVLDVKFLVQSFGGTCKQYEKPKPKYTHNGEIRIGQKHHRLSIALPSNILPFRLKRKLENYKPRIKYFPTRFVKKIEPIGKKEATCITVDAIDSLFVANNFIVTHNTKSSLLIAKAIKALCYDSGGVEAKIIVVSPVSVSLNWKEEAESVNEEIEIYSYAKIPPPPESSKFIAIFDEAHLLQTFTSQRTKKAIAVSKSDNCISLICLTGTPIKNGQPQNVLPLLTMIQHPLADNRRFFEKRYCDAHSTNFTQWDVTGASNLEELNLFLLDRNIRRTKEQCLSLPQKTYQTIYCYKEQDVIAQKEYKETLDGLLERYKERVINREISETGEAIVTLGYLRLCASLYKAHTTIEKAKEILNEGHQVVIFTDFVASAERIAEHFGVPCLTGEMAVKDRQEMKEAFQRGDYKVFVGTIKAGGVGITLTAASYLIMNDSPWTTGDYDQATDRIHRIGQTQNCTIYNIVGKPIDYVMEGILNKKRDVIDTVLKTYGLSQKDIQQDKINYAKIADKLTKLEKIK